MVTAAIAEPLTEESAPGRWLVRPRGDDPAAFQHLLRTCRNLSAATGGDRRVCGNLGITWIGGVHPRPVPVIDRAPGERLDMWLKGPGARAGALVTCIADTIDLIERLGAAGFLPVSPGLAGVRLDEKGSLTWLPAAFTWHRVSRTATGPSLQAASRSAAEFLHEVLLSAPAVPSISLVWEELWALCRSLLEEGLGLNAADVLTRLRQLVARCDGQAGTPPAPETYVLLAVESLQAWLGCEHLDWAGLLRQTLGPAPVIRGLAVGGGRLPAYWPESVRSFGFRWIGGQTVDWRQISAGLRSRGCRSLVVLCGKPSDLREHLPYFDAEERRLVAMAPSSAGDLPPAHWELLSPGRSSAPWRRIGWPLKQRVEVPGDVVDQLPQ